MSLEEISTLVETKVHRNEINEVLNDYRQIMQEKLKVRVKGPKWSFQDVGYLALWEPKDIPLLDRFFQKIRLTKDRGSKIKMITSWTKALRHQYNDHYCKELQLNSSAVCSPMKVSKNDEDDILAIAGVIYLCLQAVNATTVHWDYGAVGTGTTAAEVWNQALVTESFVQDVANHGFFEAAGATLQGAVTFGESLATTTLQESMFRNQLSPTNAIGLNRQTFTINPINHVTGNSGFSAGVIIEFSPDVDLGS